MKKSNEFPKFFAIHAVSADKVMLYKCPVCGECTYNIQTESCASCDKIKGEKK